MDLKYYFSINLVKLENNFAYVKNKYLVSRPFRGVIIETLKNKDIT